MTFAEHIWRNAITARSNMLTAANYSAAFYGNAALQGWQLGLTAPLTFWQTIARTAQSPANSDTADNVVEMLRDIVSEPSATVVEEEVSELVEAEAETQPAARPTPKPVEEAVKKPAPKPAPKVELAEPVPAPNPALLDAPRGGKADDLTVVRGIGAKLAASLNEIGIYHFDQIAALDAEGIDWLDQNIPGFKLSCGRFDIVTEAAKQA